MGDVVIVEAAQHMEYGIGLADVGEEFVAEPFAFACPFDESGDVYYLHRGRHHAFGFAHLHKFGQAVIRDGDDTYIGFDGAEREVGALCLGV